MPGLHDEPTDEWVASAGALTAGKPRKSVGTYSVIDVLLNPRILSKDRAVDQGNAADIAAVQDGETRR